MMIVVLHCIPKPQSGPDVFECPASRWGALRKLGESYGWRPAGTMLRPGLPPEVAQEEEHQIKELQETLPENWEALAVSMIEEQQRQVRATGKVRSFIVFDGPGVDLRERGLRADLYEPRDPWGMWRVVTQEDAANWANAIEHALADMERLDIDLPHEGACAISENIEPALNLLANGGLKCDFMRRFIDYARKGAFGFAWDD